MALRWDHAELALMPTGAAPSYGPGSGHLDNRFGAKHQQQQSRVLLNTMKRQKSEPLQELLENIERRVRLAYPEATGDVQEALTMHHLTSAVDERMQAELLRRKPKRLQDALEVLTTEEAIRDCNRYQHTTPVREVKAGEEAAQQQHTTSDDVFNAAVMRLTEKPFSHNW